jgi:hypothetical protein
MEFYKFIKREGLHTNFIVNIDYSEYGKTKSFSEEVKEHIKAIVSNYDSVYLLFSGGMDSRFLALNLLELGIDFTAVTYVFKEDFTDYDSQVSTEFAKKHGFKHEIFYIDVGRLQKSVDSYLDKKFFIPLLNPHYIISAINEYNKPNCVFLTGACSEFKIEYGIVELPWNFLMVKDIHPNVYNFTTNKILLSYFDEPIIKEFWKDRSLGKFGARDKLYNSIYPDKLNIIKKQLPEDESLSRYWHRVIFEKYKVRYPALFHMDKFRFSLEKHYKTIEELNNGS